MLKKKILSRIHQKLFKIIPQTNEIDKRFNIPLVDITY